MRAVDHTQRFLWVDEETARSRVILLKRMKDRLICEWHPVIDVLIKDYETGLKQIDFERDGPDDDRWGTVNNPIGSLIGRNYTPPSSDDL